MKITKAKISDLKEIAELRRQTLKKINSKSLPESDIKVLTRMNSLSSLKKRIKQAEMFVIKDKNKIMGTVDLKNNEIKGFYVEKNNINKGVGSKLLEFIEKYSKDRGHRILWLECNKSAKGFYLKKGFNCIDTRNSNKKITRTIYVMEKKLCNQ